MNTLNNDNLQRAAVHASAHLLEQASKRLRTSRSVLKEKVGKLIFCEISDGDFDYVLNLVDRDSVARWGIMLTSIVICRSDERFYDQARALGVMTKESVYSLGRYESIAEQQQDKVWQKFMPPPSHPDAPRFTQPDLF